jgi:phosphoribosylglycinamide formyltransferase-1
MPKLAIFASGSGTNAQRIIEYFKGHSDISVCLVLSNNPKAYVIDRSLKLGIPHVIFNREEFYNQSKIYDDLAAMEIDYLILAGFLWLIPPNLLSAFSGKILNIHPALLPKFGGRGMYGQKVHEAVIAAGEKESGITIHLVNEHYDEGQIIFQAKCELFPKDTPADVAAKVHELEYHHFPEVIERFVKDDMQKKSVLTCGEHT